MGNELIHQPLVAALGLVAARKVMPLGRITVFAYAKLKQKRIVIAMRV